LAFESLGLVERRAAKGDQRVRFLEPSRRGRKMLDQFAITRREYLNEHLGGWSDEERSRLLVLLTRFADTFADIEKMADAKRSSPVQGRPARKPAERALPRA
jgi:DNA-binding MarR family transcriptional regulator